MTDFDTNVRISEIERSIDKVRLSVETLLERVKPEEELWDNSDIIRHWKISERTLASWRANGKISFIQMNGKIWYPKHAREEFLSRNLIHY